MNCGMSVPAIDQTCNLLHGWSSTSLRYRPPERRWQCGGVDVKQRIEAVIAARDDLTVRNVALKAGMSDSILHKFLTKPEQSMTLRSLERIAEAMGLSLQVLLFGEPEKAPSADEQKVVSIWKRIPSAERATALRMLEGIAESA